MTVIALRRPGDPRQDHLAGVEVVRLDVQRHQGAGLVTYLREYVSFGVRASWAAIRRQWRHRYRVVQVASLPDFLAFAALPLRLMGVPLVLDLHEAMPLFFQSRFPRASGRVYDRLLHLQERASIGLSTVTVTVNEAMRDRPLALGIEPHRLMVVPNVPSLQRFDRDRFPVRPFRADGHLRLVYAGALTPTYEVDVAIGAVAHLVATRPDLDVTFDVYGRGDSAPGLRELVQRAGLDDRVRFHGRIPIDGVPAALAARDVGLAPTRLDAFTRLTMSTKIHEYAAMGKPVVATRLPLVERTFPAGSVSVYDSGDALAMAAAIAAVADDPARRDDAVARSAEYVAEVSWERTSMAYVALIERLGAGGGATVEAAVSGQPVPR